jgi:hypothetical protein
VTVSGRVPVYLYIFSETELTLTGQSIMRESAEICGAPCDDDDLEGVFIVTTGFFRGQLRGSYTGASRDITIPLSITVTDPEPPEDITVTSIYQDVFSGKDLTNVTFAVGNEFTRIHARAFQDNNLETIIFPASLKRIDLRAFRNNKLTQVTIPEGVHTIEQLAFAENTITEVTIGPIVETIGDNIFGTNTYDFVAKYRAEGAGAGTYNLVGTSWEKQP